MKDSFKIDMFIESILIIQASKQHMKKVYTYSVFH